MGKLIRDTANHPIQVFAPRRMQAVTATEAWTPTAGDVAFAVTAYCTYSISGGDAVDLYKGEIRGIVEGKTYTFSVTQSLEVM